MAAPANDLLVNAQVLLPLTTQVSGDNSEATIESGEVRGQGGSPYFTADFTVWYRWTAPSTASATFTVTGSPVDYVVTIWQAASGATDPVTDFADLEIVDSGDGTDVPLTFTPVADRMYYIQYAGFNFASSGPFTLSYPPVGPYPFASGIAARNGTSSHTIPFGFTSTSGSLLCVVVFGGVTHAASGWTEQLSPVSSGELSVFTKTSAGDSSITVTHNASNYPVAWAAYEFPAGSSYTVGSSDNDSSDTFPGLSGLPGTEQLIIAARGRIAGGSESGAGTTWTAPWVESVDLFTAASGTDGCYLTIGVQPDYTSTSITPTASTTHDGTWGVGDREKAVFAIEVAAPGGGGTHDGVGTAAGTSTASGSATVTRSASGTASGTAAVSGAATRTISSTATTTGTATASAVSVVGRNATSTTAGTSDTTGAATITRTTVGTATGTAGGDGTATITAVAVATTSTASTASGAGALTRITTGTAAGTAAASGDATLTGASAYGDATGTSTASGASTVVHAATGTASAVSTGAGAATVDTDGTGAASAVGTASGDATTAVGNTSTAPGISAATGTASILCMAAGVADGVSSVSGSAGIVIAAVGTAAGISTAVGVSEGRRRPGVLTAGTRRSRLTAGALRGPTTGA